MGHDMSGFPARENQLFDILQTFSENELPFLVIGGYAVSAFHHRFSVDVDMVIQADQLDRFDELLRTEGYEQFEDRQLAQGRFVAYRKDAELPVTVDLMVDAVQSRKTGGTWGFDELDEQAHRTEIEGSETAVTVRIPTKELLVAMKLHSARLTDARDVVALADDVDFDRVAGFMDRGDPDQLTAALERVRGVITAEGFVDAFKGVFATRERPEARIKAVETFLEEQIAIRSS